MSIGNPTGMVLRRIIDEIDPLLATGNKMSDQLQFTSQFSVSSKLQCGVIYLLIHDRYDAVTRPFVVILATNGYKSVT